MEIDISHVPGASASLVARLDGTVKTAHGSWAAGSESDVVKLALHLLEDSGAIVALQNSFSASGPTGGSNTSSSSGGGSAAAPARGSFQRLSLSFPDTGVAYIITLDKEYVYIVKTSLAS